MAGVIGGPAASALDACTAGQIVAQDSTSCPLSSACTITKVLQVGDGCIFDFGVRDVIVSGTLEGARAG